METKQELINELKEICQEIGCSGFHPKLCKEEPHKCNIIRKFILHQKPKGE